MLRDPSLIPLSHQHHNGLALALLTERSLAADASEPNIARLAARIAERYDIELTNHFDLEERYLFPALSRLALVAELIGEHRQMSELVQQLREKPEEAAIRAFCALIRTHIRREENELFETAQRLLPRETLDEIGRALEQHAVRVCL